MSQEDQIARSPVAEALLHSLCSATHFEWPNLPYPKAKMVRTLLNLIEAPLLHSIPNVLPKYSKGVYWPTVPRRSLDYPIRANTTHAFVESLVSILEAFLGAGIDPTDVPSHVPKDFRCDREVFVWDIMQRLPSCGDSEIKSKEVFHHANVVFSEAVFQQRRERSISQGHAIETKIATKMRYLHVSAEGDSATQNMRVLVPGELNLV